MPIAGMFGIIEREGEESIKQFSHRMTWTFLFSQPQTDDYPVEMKAGKGVQDFKCDKEAKEMHGSFL